MSNAGNRRVVVITGAARGLGKEVALCFGKTGARVIVNCRFREEEARAVAREIIAAGGDAIVWRADVRMAAEVDRMMHAALERWGAIDVLINNAGLTKDGLL